MCPYFAACGGDGVAEGEEGFWIPGCGPWFELSRLGEVVGPHSDDGEQAEQDRSGAQDGFVGPLTLGFDAEMGASFLEGDFDLPTADEPGEDVAWLSVEVCGEEGLRLELALGIADEKPSDRHRGHAAAIPDGRSAGDLDEAVGATIPEADTVALPSDFGIFEDSGELFEGLAFDGRPAAAFALLRWEVEEIGIEPQAGDDTDVAADSGEELDCREGAVGDQDNIATGEPAVDLQGGLAGPIEQGLGGAVCACIEAFGRGEQGEEGQRHE